MSPKTDGSRCSAAKRNSLEGSDEATIPQLPAARGSNRVIVIPWRGLGTGDDPGDVGIFALARHLFRRLLALELLAAGGILLLLLLTRALARSFILHRHRFLHGVSASADSLLHLAAMMS